MNGLYLSEDDAPNELNCVAVAEMMTRLNESATAGRALLLGLQHLDDHYDERCPSAEVWLQLSVAHHQQGDYQEGVSCRHEAQLCPDWEEFVTRKVTALLAAASESNYGADVPVIHSFVRGLRTDQMDHSNQLAARMILWGEIEYAVGHYRAAFDLHTYTHLLWLLGNPDADPVLVRSNRLCWLRAAVAVRAPATAAMLYRDLMLNNPSARDQLAATLMFTLKKFGVRLAEKLA